MKLREKAILITLLVLFLLLIVQPLSAYDYDSAQIVADRSCSRSLYFPLKQPAPSICGFRGYRAPTGNWHGGNDYTASEGTPILAVANGRVSKITNGVGNTYPYQYVYGNVVYIDHPNGLQTRYGHLQINSITVKVGQRVKVGQIIGRMDNSGYSSGTHLHFEVRIGTTSYGGGIPVDPYPKLWVKGSPIPSAATVIIDKTAKKATKKAGKDLGKIPFPDLGGKLPPMRILSCNIPAGAEGVDCVPSIRLHFSEPVSAEDVKSVFFLRPVPLVPYLVVSHLEDQSQVEISGFLLSAQQGYRIGFRDELVSTKGNTLKPWQISFTTGDWPHPPMGQSTQEIMIQKEITHLGDDFFNTPVNVGFQKKSEDIIWIKVFELKSLPLKATLSLRVRGSESSDPIEVNGQLVGVLNNTVENNGQIQTFPVPVQALQLGSNVICIESLINPRQNFDDFEIWEVKLGW